MIDLLLQIYLKQDWLDAAKFVQNRITDKVIEDAIQNMPKEIYTVSGREIETKLKVRIKDLDKYVLEYYDMISPEVDIVGSNLNEYFHVVRDTDGSVQVKVYNVKNNSMGEIIFFMQGLFSKMKLKILGFMGWEGEMLFGINKLFKVIMMCVIWSK